MLEFFTAEEVIQRAYDQRRMRSEMRYYNEAAVLCNKGIKAIAYAISGYCEAVIGARFDYKGHAIVITEVPGSSEYQASVDGAVVSDRLQDSLIASLMLAVDCCERSPIIE